MLLPTFTSSASFFLLLATATTQFETVLAHPSTSGSQIGGLTGKNPVRKYARTWQHGLKRVQRQKMMLRERADIGSLMHQQIGEPDSSDDQGQDEASYTTAPALAASASSDNLFTRGTLEAQENNAAPSSSSSAQGGGGREALSPSPSSSYTRQALAASPSSSFSSNDGNGRNPIENPKSDPTRAGLSYPAHAVSTSSSSSASATPSSIALSRDPLGGSTASSSTTQGGSKVVTTGLLTDGRNPLATGSATSINLTRNPISSSSSSRSALSGTRPSSSSSAPENGGVFASSSSSSSSSSSTGLSEDGTSPGTSSTTPTATSSLPLETTSDGVELSASPSVSVVTENSVVVTVVNGVLTSSTSTGRSTSTHLVYVTADDGSVSSSSSAVSGVGANANTQGNTGAASRLEMSALVGIAAIVVGGLMLM